MSGGRGGSGEHATAIASTAGSMLQSRVARLAQRLRLQRRVMRVRSSVRLGLRGSMRRDVCRALLLMRRRRGGGGRLLLL